MEMTPEWRGLVPIFAENGCCVSGGLDPTSPVSTQRQSWSQRPQIAHRSNDSEILQCRTIPTVLCGLTLDNGIGNPKTT